MSQQLISQLFVYLRLKGNKWFVREPRRHQ
uniref:Uncharacterized protein n=1 Tax=Anguilla anguilla TaxID=7936 RepID=A0A0E9RWN1_ANGAN